MGRRCLGVAHRRGHADRAHPAGHDAHPSIAHAPLETGRRIGGAGQPVQRPRHPLGRAGRRRHGFRRIRRGDRPQDARRVAGRGIGHPDRPVARPAVPVRRQALQNQADRFLPSPAARAATAHPHLGGRRVAEAEIDAARAAIRRPVAREDDQGRPVRSPHPRRRAQDQSVHRGAPDRGNAVTTSWSKARPPAISPRGPRPPCARGPRPARPGGSRRCGRLGSSRAAWTRCAAGCYRGRRLIGPPISPRHSPPTGRTPLSRC